MLRLWSCYCLVSQIPIKLVLKGQEKEDDKEDLEEQVYEPNIDEI